jgi:selenocysteine-specific elongation factor
LPADALAAAGAVIDRLIADGLLVRDGDRVRDPGQVPAGPSTETVAAMGRLEAALDMPAPPSLADAARSTGCPPDGLRALEASGRIVRLGDDLAWSTRAYARLASIALEMAGRSPLTPAAFRDATGTSRKYVMAILEDLDRRGWLRRTPAGHVLGPRAPLASARAPERAKAPENAAVR